MAPQRSYTLWFSQRTGSTLLAKALESTGIAGRPNEWLQSESELDLLHQYDVNDVVGLQARLWELGSTPNGVFGIKHSFHEPHFSHLIRLLQKIPGSPQKDQPRPAVWEHTFPNHRHIFMTRRNKVRLAVSWWRAICSQEWHRTAGSAAREADLSGLYNFDAINHLYLEASMREAGIQEFLSEASIVPLTVTYEDFVHNYEGTVKAVLRYLGLEAAGITVAAPHFERLADAVTETWVQRFRAERQSDWDHHGW